MPDRDLFTLNGDWVVLMTAASAFLFMIGAILLNRLRAAPAPITAASITLDLFRGASAFPLALFALGPVFPALAEAGKQVDPLILSIAAASALATVIADWWRNI